MSRPLICGFIKVRNEIVREGNIYRAFKNVERFCDVIVACDDASTDGTREFLKTKVEKQNLILVPRNKQSFAHELFWKQRMLERVHKIRPHWIWWHDGDETLDERGVLEIRSFCEAHLRTIDQVPAFRVHYTQLWRSKHWARVDQGFDEGMYIKLWRWQPDLVFDAREGTHHHQFPEQILEKLKEVGVAPWEVVHWGNYGVNLRWKCIQYWGGLGGVERHLSFENAVYRAVSRDKRAEKYEQPVHDERADEREQPVRQKRASALTQTVDLKRAVARESPVISECAVQAEKTVSMTRAVDVKTADAHKRAPKPFSPDEKRIIRSLKNLRSLEKHFTVVIPTYNRADYLETTLTSLLAQTYDKWVAIVLDDGSTDDTPKVMRRWQDKDPRFFYARYPHKGACWINERGMDIACEWTEYWTRLGSDDWFEPKKLEADAYALREREACYGPYSVLRKVDDGWAKAEKCNPYMEPGHIRDLLVGGNFVVSWANIACRTSVLKKVKQIFGRYCPRELKVMEDFIVNSRIARVADFVYRDAGEPDAIWRVNPRGASSDQMTTGNEDVLTKTLIAKDNERFGTERISSAR